MIFWNRDDYRILWVLEKREEKSAIPRLWKSVLKAVCNQNVTAWRCGVNNNWLFFFLFWFRTHLIPAGSNQALAGEDKSLLAILRNWRARRGENWSPLRWTSLLPERVFLEFLTERKMILKYLRNSKNWRTKWRIIYFKWSCVKFG